MSNGPTPPDHPPAWDCRGSIDQLLRAEGPRVGRRLVLSEMRSLIGSELGVSKWYVIDQAQIDQFAACTHDPLWIHVDIERARRQSPFGTTIAHGFLTLSMLAPTATEVWIDALAVGAILNYGIERVRFINPVRAGARIRNRVNLIAIDDRPTGTLVTTENTVEIEGEAKPALVATMLTMVMAGRCST
jgi:acyl dehydratase